MRKPPALHSTRCIHLAAAIAKSKPALPVGPRIEPAEMVEPGLGVKNHRKATRSEVTKRRDQGESRRRANIDQNKRRRNDHTPDALSSDRVVVVADDEASPPPPPPLPVTPMPPPSSFAALLAAAAAAAVSCATIWTGRAALLARAAARVVLHKKRAWDRSDAADAERASPPPPPLPALPASVENTAGIDRIG